MVEYAAPRKQRNVILAGIDEIGILLASRRHWSYAENTVFTMNENLAIRSEIRRNQERNADAKIDVGSLRQVAGHAIGNAVACQCHVPVSSYRGAKSRGSRSISTI